MENQMWTRRTTHLLFILAAALIGVAARVHSGERADTVKVVLDAEGDEEVAPHGKGNIYAPDVMRDGNLFRMWYGGQGRDGHDRIAYAESTDGVRWVRNGVVLKDDAANHVNDPSVVKVKGEFFMYYTRTERDVVDRIYLAVSADGKKWEPRGVAVDAGKAGEWDSLSVGRPSVIHDGDHFKMWYDGRKDFPPDAPVRDVPKSPTSKRCVGYATSKDGVEWLKHDKNPVRGDDVGAVDVKRVGDKLLMVYESRDGTRFATSEDGLAWDDKGVYCKKSGSKTDLFGHVTPFLLVGHEKSEHRLFVGAAGATTWDCNRIAAVEISDAELNRRLGVAKK
jgi:hypothetical protein